MLHYSIIVSQALPVITTKYSTHTRLHPRHLLTVTILEIFPCLEDLNILQTEQLRQRRYRKYWNVRQYHIMVSPTTCPGKCRSRVTPITSVRSGQTTVTQPIFTPLTQSITMSTWSQPVSRSEMIVINYMSSF